MPPQKHENGKTAALTAKLFRDLLSWPNFQPKITRVVNFRFIS